MDMHPEADVHDSIDLFQWGEEFVIFLTAEDHCLLK